MWDDERWKQVGFGAGEDGVSGKDVGYHLSQNRVEGVEVCVCEMIVMEIGVWEYGSNIHSWWFEEE